MQREWNFTCTTGLHVRSYQNSKNETTWSQANFRENQTTALDVLLAQEVVSRAPSQAHRTDMLYDQAPDRT